MRACAPARVLGRQPVVESSQTVSGCSEENSGLRVRVLRTHQAVACCPTRRSSRRSGRNRDEHSRARTSLPGRPQDTVAVRTHHPHCLSLSPLLAASTHRFRTGSHHCPGTDSACTARVRLTVPVHSRTPLVAAGQAAQALHCDPPTSSVPWLSDETTVRGVANCAPWSDSLRTISAAQISVNAVTQSGRR